jgi:hypothetical protein
MMQILLCLLAGSLAFCEPVKPVSQCQVANKVDALRQERPDAKDILQQVVLDLISNPNLQSPREFYGPARLKVIALQSDSPVTWPKNWRPNAPGCEIHFQSAADPLLSFIYWNIPWGVEICGFIRQKTPRILGVRLDVLCLDLRDKPPHRIEVCLFNIGGNGGEDTVVGGCCVYYDLKYEKGKWLIDFAGSLDP